MTSGWSGRVSQSASSVLRLLRASLTAGFDSSRLAILKNAGSSAGPCRRKSPRIIRKLLVAGLFESGSATSDASGRFTVPAGTPAYFHVEAEGYEAADRLTAVLSEKSPFEAAEVAGSIKTDRKTGGVSFNVNIPLAAPGGEA